jgi:hypothetical protein
VLQPCSLPLLPSWATTAALHNLMFELFEDLYVSHGHRCMLVSHISHGPAPAMNAVNDHFK